MKNTLLLALNDLAIAFKNKTLLLVLFIPLFVFISLNLVDGNDTQASAIKLGLLQDHAYTPEISDSIEAAKHSIEVTWLEDKDQGLRLLKEHKINGLVSNDAQESGNLELLVLKKESVHTTAIVQSFAALQKAAEGDRPNWISDVKGLYEVDIQQETLPTWILMVILLVGFIILPAQIAEEKEKKLLLGLLQTPIHEVQWLAAKLLLGMALMMIATLFLHLLSNVWPVHLLSYIGLILVGGFCFSAYGVFLGFLCRNQATARTLGVIVYLPHLLPSAMADVSQQLTAIAPFLPSYQLYEPLRSILLENGNLATMSFDWMYLVLLGVVMFSLAYVLMKKRWLM
ncbi:MAG TPA: ABC transporter permease [Thiopseudomonas sp.]|nr:ABC transporter permease [Thiopseudomonas sp.]